MGLNADISWLHPPGLMPGATWSPWHGCTAVHTGCLLCWATAMNRRFGHDNFGRGKPRRVTADAGWKQVERWARAAAKAGKRMLVAPLDCDILDAEVYERDEATSPGVNYWAGRQTFDRFMDLIHVTGEVAVDGMTGKLVTGCYETQVVGGITWLLLTKRPENWRWIPEHVRPYCWLIYSASDQPSLDAGKQHLLSAEGFAGLGLSLEPLVGPIDMMKATGDTSFDGGGDFGPDPRWKNFWAIIGGESGAKARPCNLAWIRDAVRQFRNAHAVPYVKQLGSTRETGAPGDLRWLSRVQHRAGADPSEWPEAFPQKWPEGLR